MTIAKWFMILLYWLWLNYRNIQSVRRHDWRLWVQIGINTAVICLLVLEEIL